MFWWQEELGITGLAGNWVVGNGGESVFCWFRLDGQVGSDVNGGWSVLAALELGLLV